MNNLPELPRVLNKREADWTTDKFKPWCEKQGKTFAFEIKYAKKDYLNFNEVKPHQVANLLKVRHETFYHKIPDMGDKNPFDGISLTQQPAYVVIKYPTTVAIIPIDVFVLESKRSKRRSLTAERAMEISTINFR